ncbi:cupin domain-containing protein [Streptomyces sp. MBT53]|uniref:cupin domain-containing protein n=1 Tax=Streptomyces sp. MBT53 TaxID=1488384 RepID=UPI001F3CEE15|nr:cupin domain-containing protein [Streptomyces sp. MBT53]
MGSTDGHGTHGDQEGTGPRMLADVIPPFVPEGASVMTVLVEWPPGHPGTPPHRHSGPCFGYVTEGAVRWELEGEPERVIRAGETFWEPGGEVIHYQNGNATADATAKYVVVMLGAPGEPMLTLVDEEELESRAHLRAPRPPAG